MIDNGGLAKGQGNRDDINAPHCMLHLMKLQIMLGAGNQAFPFGGLNTGKCRFGVGRTARAYLNKNKDSAISGNKVNFTVGTVPVPCQDAVSLLL
jgi:hypothetical protein